MTHPDSQIHDVSDTSFWVAYFRAKESTRPDALFHDPFAMELVGTKGRALSEAMPQMSRYVEWSVVSRTVIIDRFIQQLIADGVDAVINLGAGLDTRPYRMALPPTLDWVEADYPHIIGHKKKILASSTPRCRLTQVEIDLSNESARRSFLSAVVPHAKKALILTEGVIPYLSQEQVAALGQDLHAQERFRYWITEYFHPKLYRYLNRRTRTSAMKNAPFLFQPADWYGFFEKLGWRSKELRYGGEIAQEFGRTVPLPGFARFMLKLLPRKVFEQSQRMAGYGVMERATQRSGTGFERAG